MNKCAIFNMMINNQRVAAGNFYDNSSVNSYKVVLQFANADLVPINPMNRMG